MGAELEPGLPRRFGARTVGADLGSPSVRVRGQPAGGRWFAPVGGDELGVGDWEA